MENARDFGDGEANVDINVADEEAAAQNGEENENWREWERVADELTWQRLLGLDGSLLFLEHVFWVISLNTIFTILFGLFEYMYIFNRCIQCCFLIPLSYLVIPFKLQAEII